MKQLPAHTYLITNRLNRSFWGKRIIQAEKTGRFNNEDRKLAHNWPTCACGKLDPLILHEKYTGPVDHSLNRLGIFFFDNGVRKNDFTCTAKTLVSIEKRATKLLLELKMERH